MLSNIMRKSTRIRKLREFEGIKIIDAMKMMFDVRRLSLGLKRKLFERVVVPRLPFGTETLGVRMDERHERGIRK